LTPHAARIGAVTGAVWRPLLELRAKPGEALRLPAAVVDAPREADLPDLPVRRP
jgi:hypothetical protein